MIKARNGDRVYWNDPDNDICSGYCVIVKSDHPEVWIVRKDNVDIEVDPLELTWNKSND